MAHQLNGMSRAQPAGARQVGGQAELQAGEQNLGEPSVTEDDDPEIRQPWLGSVHGHESNGPGTRHPAVDRANRARPTTSTIRTGTIDRT